MVIFLTETWHFFHIQVGNYPPQYQCDFITKRINISFCTTLESLTGLSKYCQHLTLLKLWWLLDPLLGLVIECVNKKAHTLLQLKSFCCMILLGECFLFLAIVVLRLPSPWREGQICKDLATSTEATAVQKQTQAPWGEAPETCLSQAARPLLTNMTGNQRPPNI